MNNQQKMWNMMHAEGRHARFRASPMPFALEVEPWFPRKGRVLELGCGVGSDAYYFAEQGHNVLATDFSEVVIRQNKTQFSLPNLDFEMLDLRQDLPFETTSFDVVYAHLSLHYYDDVTTRKLLTQIAALLKTGGQLCFVCKSTNDPKFGQGKQLEADYFESSSGHVRHFFSTAYVTDVLAGTFVIAMLEERQTEFYTESSSFIACRAVKV